MIKGKIHMGIGFATGRTSFLNVLRAYIFHLRESHFLSKYNVLLCMWHTIRRIKIRKNRITML